MVLSYAVTPELCRPSTTHAPRLVSVVTHTTRAEVTALALGTGYRFSVVANNALGSGPVVTSSCLSVPGTAQLPGAVSRTLFTPTRLCRVIVSTGTGSSTERVDWERPQRQPPIHGCSGRCWGTRRVGTTVRQRRRDPDNSRVVLHSGGWTRLCPWQRHSPLRRKAVPHVEHRLCHQRSRRCGCQHHSRCAQQCRTGALWLRHHDACSGSNGPCGCWRTSRARGSDGGVGGACVRRRCPHHTLRCGRVTWRADRVCAGFTRWSHGGDNVLLPDDRDQVPLHRGCV